MLSNLHTICFDQCSLPFHILKVTFKSESVVLNPMPRCFGGRAFEDILTCANISGIVRG